MDCKAVYLENSLVSPKEEKLCLVCLGKSEFPVFGFLQLEFTGQANHTIPLMIRKKSPTQWGDLHQFLQYQTCCTCIMYLEYIFTLPLPPSHHCLLNLLKFQHRWGIHTFTNPHGMYLHNTGILLHLLSLLLPPKRRVKDPIQLWSPKKSWCNSRNPYYGSAKPSSPHCHASLCNFSLISCSFLSSLIFPVV